MEANTALDRRAALSSDTQANANPGASDNIGYAPLWRLPMAYPVLSGAEAFAFPGGDVGVLRHGFTGSPQGLRPWGEALRDDGHTILCPLLLPAG